MLMRRLTLALLLPAFVGCSPPPASIVTGPVRPAVWEVRDADTRLILIGSIHALPGDVAWSDAPVMRDAAAQADELWLEVTPADLAAIPAQFAQASRDETVPPLDQRLGQQTAERVRDYAGDAGIGAQDADATESWALALAISNVLTSDAGLASANGVEARLIARFGAAGKPVRGLERGAEQLALFDALPSALQNSLLAKTVADAPHSRTQTLALVRAWARGDVRMIAAQTAADLAQTPGLAEPLVLARNRAWAARLAQRMAQPGTVLIAVGIGHLVGDGAVTSLLRARGLRVRRVQ